METPKVKNPAKFKDALNREWFCRVDWAAMRRSVAADCDLSQIEGDIGDFHRGSVKLIDALWAVLSPEAAKVGVTLDQFEAGMFGEAIERGREALLAGVADFFPKARGLLIGQASQEVAAEIQALRDRLRKPSTGSQEKSELSPTN